MDTTTCTSAAFPASTTAYYCHRCGKWYLSGNVSCGVMHADGHCHYGDREVTVTEVPPSDAALRSDGR